MNITKQLKLISLIQNKHTRYHELIEFLFGDTPPEDHNFLSRINLAVISETLRSPAYDEWNLYENPNNAASICFLIRSPFHYYIYKDIYRHLPESEFVIDAVWIKRNVESWDLFLSRFAEFLKTEGVRFSILKMPGESVRKFFEKYTVFVFHTTIMEYMYDLPSQKKVRVMYGHAKDSYNFGPWSRYYDAALTYGPYSHKFMSNFTKSIIVGNSRFDDWFTGKLMGPKIKDFQCNFDSSKKTLLYIPTHGNLSSLDIILPELKKITLEFNVIIRPHWLTEAVETERMENIRAIISQKEKSMFFADNFFDLVELLSVADIIISDNSGAIFDAVLADKPVILVDFLEDGFFEKNMENATKRTADLWNLPLTYPQSIEQRIKTEAEIQPGEILKNGYSILDALKNVVRKEKKYREARERLRKMLFYYYDGSSGKRAAEAIRQIAKKPKRNRSFLEYAIQTGIFNETAHFRTRISELRAVAENYVNLSPTANVLENIEITEFSIIIPTYNGVERISAVLNVLINQKGLLGRYYEIIVIDDGSQKKSKIIVEDFIRKRPDIKITYIWYEKNRGPAFAKNIGIKISRGKFICFTDDDCIVSYDWLKKIKESFEKHPEIAGVGGWYKPIGTILCQPSVYDRFIYWYHIPEILREHKSVTFTGNKVGNTGNVCYRKSALLAIGGFNHYFRYPSLEDWELKMRMHKSRFSLLFLPSLEALHKKNLGLIGFIHHFFLRGWASYLLYSIHPDLSQFNITAYNRWIFSIYDFPHWFYKKNFATLTNVKFSYKFAFLNIMRNFYLWMGKYWIAYDILRESKKSSTRRI